MTLDELIKQLNKIKEVYPDSGSFRTTFECEFGTYNVSKIIKFSDKNIVIIQSHRN
jgi:hypothetical protein